MNKSSRRLFQKSLIELIFIDASASAHMTSLDSREAADTMFKARWLLLFLVMTATLVLTANFLSTRNKPTGFSVYATDGLGVFWDENCTENVNFIDWGTVLPGSTRNVRLYVYNGMNESIFLYMETENWVPLKARDVIEVALHHKRRSIKPTEVLNTTLSLQVAGEVYNVTGFDFDLKLNGLLYAIGDLNRDSKVDMRDVGITAKAYGSYSGHPRWNPLADLNEDGEVDMYDVTAVAKEYGLQ